MSEREWDPWNAMRFACRMQWTDKEIEPGEDGPPLLPELTDEEWAVVKKQIQEMLARSVMVNREVDPPAVYPLLAVMPELR